MRSLGDGFVFDFLEKKGQLQLGAYAYYDFATIDQNRFFDQVFGGGGQDSELRTARIQVRGKLFREVHLRFEIALEDQDDIQITDFYLLRSNIPYLGEMRIGQVKEPFGLDQQQSSRYRPFMEPSLLTSLTPGRNVGIKFSDSQFNERLTWAAGIFLDTNTFDSVSSTDGWGFSSRVTGLPYVNRERKELLHLGLAYLERYNLDDVDVQVRPESHLAPTYLGTGSVALDGKRALGLEAAYQRGPWLFQGEYIHTWLKDAEYDFDISLDNITLSGTAERGIEFDTAYMQASYVLTGETREYYPSQGVFGTVTPDRNFGLWKKRGPGAWEVAARLSHIDLNDKFVQGGKETNFTLGLNWYLNPNCRIMFNYIHADVDVRTTIQLPNNSPTVKMDDDVNIFQVRFQLDFAPKSLSSLGMNRIFHR